MTTLRQSPLHSVHEELGARFTEFAGWHLPLRYPTGSIGEHLATRSAVGIFDVSHLGRVEISGSEAFRLLQYFLSNDLRKISPGSCQYSLVLEENGGVIDDVIVWWLSERRFLLLPNASNTAEVLRRLVALRDDMSVDVTVNDNTLDTAMIAVQGPLWRDAAEAAGLSGDVLPTRMRVRSSDSVIIAGTGYTGEPGCEVVMPRDDAPSFFLRLVEEAKKLGGAAAGLGARDSLRLEMGYPLHGNEMDRDVTPFEAGLGWAVSLEKGDFVGREAAESAAKSPRWTAAGIMTHGRDAIPRRGYRVSLADPSSEMAKKEAEEPHATSFVTSGGYSPSCEAGIALIRTEPPAPEEGSTAWVNVRGEWKRATIKRPPFVKPKKPEALQRRTLDSE